MPRIGDVVAEKYRLEKVAGEGGMGIVYAAEHLVLKQRVAVKVLLPEAATSEGVVERFRSEARAAAKLDSEHVARVLDAGSLASGAPFLVMEYLEGCDLEELLALQKSLPVGEVVDYLIQALEGLAHAHAAGIIHRDLKPANLFLACRPDGTNAIKLVDFGISKRVKAKPEDKKLTGQHVLGSPTYMSPEQLRNATNIDGRADLWSLGVVGYELLTGAPPFDGDGVGEIFAAILDAAPTPLAERDPRIPEELSNILGRCLRRDPDERWPDAATLARALAPFAGEPVSGTVDRAEQVLLRAKMLASPATPLETRRVVDAIDAAAERARTTGASTDGSGPALLLARRREAAPPRAAGKLRAFARRSPLAVGVLGAVATLTLGLGILGAARAGAARGDVLGEVRAPLASAPALATATATASAPPTSTPPVVPAQGPAATAPTSEPTPAAERAAPAASHRPTKPGKRPKFLTTRE